MQAGSLVELQETIDGTGEYTFPPYGSILSKGTIATVAEVKMSGRALVMEDIDIVPVNPAVGILGFSARMWKEIQSPMEVDISEIQHSPLKIEELV